MEDLFALVKEWAMDEYKHMSCIADRVFHVLGMDIVFVMRDPCAFGATVIFIVAAKYFVSFAGGTSELSLNFVLVSLEL